MLTILLLEEMNLLCDNMICVERRMWVSFGVWLVSQASPVPILLIFTQRFLVPC